MPSVQSSSNLIMDKIQRLLKSLSGIYDYYIYYREILERVYKAMKEGNIEEALAELCPLIVRIFGRLGLSYSFSSSWSTLTMGKLISFWYHKNHKKVDINNNRKCVFAKEVLINFVIVSFS